jgi:hypothetical protein
VARFGLLGTRAQVVHTEWLNYAGLVLTLASGVMFLVGYGRENSGPRQKVMPRRSIESSNGEENEEDKARPEVHLR